MREKDKALATQCEQWAKTSREAEQWIAENDELVGGEAEPLRRRLRRAARTFQRLGTAAARKMCVGVFGPSQAGKSYLISALARDAEGELTADFCGEAVDFIRKINPEGGKESTGLVTRFTTTPPPGVTPERPIRLRLFTETDLVRVFANTYYADCDHKEAPDQEALLARLREAESMACSEPVNAVSADDIEDLREYLRKNFASRPLVQLLQRAFWGKAMELAPRLDLAGRTKLFECLWNATPEFSAFFQQLAGALEALGSAREANCPLDALLPREKSIIDVAMLKASSPGSSELLSIEGCGSQGRVAELSRSVVTALTAELSVYMPEKPDDFFDYTDLLDFPGYRSRLKVNDLAAELRKQDTLEAFFLRGKVAYLFERYCDEQELTGMLLCIGPSNQEVQDLPGAIAEWIRLTQGATPEERKGHAPTLFFILTKMDMEFERKQGVEDVGNRWGNRLASSLTGFFGTQYEWPSNWDGAPFRNLFLLRNPNFRCDAIFTFDDEGHETGIRDDMAAYVEDVRQAFVKSPEVMRHFTNPSESWDAAMALNDGGISLLRKRLAPICDPDRKYGQTRARAEEAARHVAAQLSPYYRSDDLEELRRQKEALSGEILKKFLFKVVQEQRFADLLRRMQVDDHVLYEMAMDSSDLMNISENGEAAPQETVIGSRVSEEDLMGDLFGDVPSEDAQPAAAPNPLDGEEEAPKVPARENRDQDEAFCRACVAMWTEQLQALAQNEAMQSRFLTTADLFGKFINEIVQSARHVRLIESMTQAVRKRGEFCNVTRDVAAWRMASEAARRINSFVAWLGHDASIGEKTEIIDRGNIYGLFKTPVLTFGAHGEPIVPAVQEQYDRPYYTDWMRALRDCMLNNIKESDDRFDDTQNRILAQIIDRFTTQSQ